MRQAKYFKSYALFAVTGMLFGSHSLLAAEISFVDAIKGGVANISFRMRYEDVNEKNDVERGGQALTLRSRLSFETKQYKLFSALLEVDDIVAIPNDENYNTGNNGQTDDAVIQDAEGTELNRVWLAYNVANTLIKYGRQSILLDNERFFGKDEWRQNEQTFTAISVLNESLNYTRLYLAQINKVEGVQGRANSHGHRDLDTKVVNLQYSGFLHSNLSLYGYWLEGEYTNNQTDTTSYGIRFSGAIDNELGFDYAWEYAKQSDAGENTLNYSTDYSLFEFGVSVKKIRLGVGIETLGADGLGFFVTPFASLHEVQGWTDQFQNGGLGNIVGGIQDRYISLGFSCNNHLSVTSIYHDFKSDKGQNGSGKLGKEWGLEVLSEWENYRFNFKYADYTKKSFGVDTQKVWLSAEVKF